MKKTYNKDKNKQENILKQGRKIEVRVFNIFRKKKDKNKDIMHLCDGIHIDEQIYEMKENRIWTLLLKGLMVYFTVAGAVLGYVSASGIKYNGIFINLVLLISSLYMSCIYYNKKSENIGNIGILIVILPFHPSSETSFLKEQSPLSSFLHLPVLLDLSSSALTSTTLLEVVLSRPGLLFVPRFT